MTAANVDPIAAVIGGCLIGLAATYLIGFIARSTGLYVFMSPAQSKNQPTACG